MSVAARCLFVCCAIVAMPAALGAQLISLKTVPIPAGEQFLLFPSRNLGMGSVGIALDDPLGDPFGNPARGARVEQMRILALPTFYGEANDAVSGRSLPLAAVVPGRVFGAFAFALQQVETPNQSNVWWVPLPAGAIDDEVIQDNSSTNVYLFGSLGTKLNRGRTAVGASIYHADLEAIDVVRMLYANSFAIEQSGSMLEARLGVTHDLGDDRTLDAIVAHNKLDMSHDVWYSTWRWLPNTQQPDVRTWNELNEDHTNTWGAHLRYTQPLGRHGRFGAILTGNTKSHPKLPNYNLVNIPRDPGNSSVFNLGVGLSSEQGLARVGVELIYEPGWIGPAGVFVTVSA
jgi:hypothetical protein